MLTTPLPLMPVPLASLKRLPAEGPCAEGEGVVCALENPKAAREREREWVRVVPCCSVNVVFDGHVSVCDSKGLPEIPALGPPSLCLRAPPPPPAPPSQPWYVAGPRLLTWRAGWCLVTDTRGRGGGRGGAGPEAKKKVYLKPASNSEPLVQISFFPEEKFSDAGRLGFGRTPNDPPTPPHRGILKQCCNQVRCANVKQVFRSFTHSTAESNKALMQWTDYLAPTGEFAVHLS